MRPVRSLSVALAVAAGLAASGALAATPPAQAKTGPGGLDYVAAEVTKRAVGTAGSATFVFHPAGAASEPRPVVVLFPAWGVVNPMAYGGWIEHLARKGNLVLVPRYQEVGRTRVADATDLANTRLRDAFAALAEDPNAKPDLEKVAYVGHLAGAGIAMNLAARGGVDKLPVPKLVLAVTPGGLASDPKARGVQLDDLTRVNSGTLLVTMIGDREHLPSDRAAKRLLHAATEVPLTRKLFLRVLSDDHGFPSLSATLTAPGSSKSSYDAASIQISADPPLAPGQPRPRQPKWSADMALSGEQTVLAAQINSSGTDALDYLGFWKALDLAMGAAFAGQDAVALRADARMSEMDRWSDGWPVRRMGAEAVREPPPPPAPAATTAPAKARRR